MYAHFRTLLESWKGFGCIVFHKIMIQDTRNTWNRLPQTHVGRGFLWRHPHWMIGAGFQTARNVDFSTLLYCNSFNEWCRKIINCPRTIYLANAAIKASVDDPRLIHYIRHIPVLRRRYLDIKRVAAAPGPVQVRRHHHHVQTEVVSAAARTLSPPHPGTDLQQRSVWSLENTYPLQNIIEDMKYLTPYSDAMDNPRYNGLVRRAMNDFFRWLDNNLTWV